MKLCSILKVFQVDFLVELYKSNISSFYFLQLTKSFIVIFTFPILGITFMSDWKFGKKSFSTSLWSDNFCDFMKICTKFVIC